jgi:FMN phosphatase YigB (HAD superfamily)
MELNEHHSNPSHLALPVSVVILRWEGLLADNEALLVEALQSSASRILGEIAPATATDLNLLRQLGEIESLGLLSTDRAIIGRLLRHFRRCYRDLTVAGPPLQPGARRLISRLAMGPASLVLLSNGDMERVRHDLHSSGLRDCFSAVLTAQDAASSGTETGSIADTLARLGVSISQSLFVTDRPFDPLAASSLGLPRFALVSTQVEAFQRDERTWLRAGSLEGLEAAISPLLNAGPDARPTG